MSDLTRTDGQPHDRLTRLCAAMSEALDNHPEHREGDRAIIFLDDGQRGGIQTHGYPNTADAIADLLVHLKALFEANGTTLSIIPIDTIGQG
jgi:hypothetical protein